MSLRLGAFNQAAHEVSAAPLLYEAFFKTPFSQRLESKIKTKHTAFTCKYGRRVQNFTQSSSESAELLQNSLTSVGETCHLIDSTGFWTCFENCRFLSSLFWLAESCWKPLVCTHTHPPTHTYTYARTNLWLFTGKPSILCFYLIFKMVSGSRQYKSEIYLSRDFEILFIPW